MTLTDKMKAWEPAAVWSEAGEGMFTVPAEAFRGVAERLKAEGFDFLRSLTGMDWAKRASAWCTTSKPPRRARTSWCGR